MKTKQKTLSTYITTNSPQREENEELLTSYKHPEISDTLDIGITILCMITLESFGSYFDKNMRPNYDFIHYSLENIHLKGISYELKNLLKEMLQMKEYRSRLTLIKEKISDFTETADRKPKTAKKNYNDKYPTARISYYLKLEDDEESSEQSSISDQSSIKYMISERPASTQVDDMSTQSKILMNSRPLIAGKISTVSRKSKKK